MHAFRRYDNLPAVSRVINIFNLKERIVIFICLKTKKKNN